MRILTLVLSALILTGCAAVPLTIEQCNATQYATAMEHEQCLLAVAKYEQEQHEKEDRRLIRRDALIIFLNACHADDTLILLENIVGRSQLPNKRQIRKAIQEYGYPYTHDNVKKRAHILDFSCMSANDLARALERAGY